MTCLWSVTPSLNNNITNPSASLNTSMTNNKCNRLKRKSLAFLANLFKLRKRNDNCLATAEAAEAAAAATATAYTAADTAPTETEATGMRIDTSKDDTTNNINAAVATANAANTAVMQQQRSPRLQNTGVSSDVCLSSSASSALKSSMSCASRPRSALHHHHSEGNNTGSSPTATADDSLTKTTSAINVSRVPSTLSVTAVDVMVACKQQQQQQQQRSQHQQSGANLTGTSPSPSHSILTLTPGRTRNIDMDMEALRLSRQDNPYLQVLASKESLIEAGDESESDDAILMSQAFDDTDPLTLAQVHEHLVRSPPPVSWSKSPVFHFPHHQRHHHHQQQHQQQASPGSKSESSTAFSRAVSPKSMLPCHAAASNEEQTKCEGSMEIRDRHSHTFSLLNPTPIRSLSEVRRMHRSAEDSVQLMSSE